MISPWAACADCARAIIMAGITKLITLPREESERWDDSIKIADTMMKEAKIEVIKLDRTFGVWLRRNGKLIEL